MTSASTLAPAKTESHQLAHSLCAAGKFAEALALLKPVLDSREGVAEQLLAETLNVAAVSALGLNQFADAENYWRQAIAVKPDFVDPYNNLGILLKGLNRLLEAEAMFRSVAAIRPDQAQAYNNLGAVLYSLKRLHDAEAAYRQAIAIRSDYAEAHYNLGIVLYDHRRLHEAEGAYRQSLAVRPDCAEAHNNLGNVYFDLMQLNEALASYRRALSLRPDYVHALTSLARVQRQQGHAAAAEESCHSALRLAPDDADSVAFLAELHADRGEFTEAEALFKRALELAPDLPAAWAGLARCRRMTDSDSSWLAVAQRLVAGKLPLRQEIYMRFAIGKYFDDVKNYEQAFHSYQQANELTRKYGAVFDRSELTRQVDRILHAYGREWLSGVRYHDALSERPIFIIGMPRSGTSLAEQILASHPAVFGAGELPFWHDAAKVFDSSALDIATEASMIGDFAQAYLRQLGELSPDAPRVVDKMPTNFKLLGLIHAALPNARIIHMRRSSIDTCLSIYFQNFSIAHAYASDLEDLAHYYSEYLRLMEHWRAALPEGAILDVSYEELVSHPQPSIRRMLEFVGLPWDERCLDFHATSRTVITPSKWQVRQKINSTSVDRWRNYERFVGPLRHLGKGSGQ